jgi:peptide/nickel transport system substrate-binding protein
MAGLGGEHPGGYTDVDNFNPYTPGISRSGLYQAATEGLFYYNMIGDEFIPWLAESYEYNADFTEVSVKLRPGVAWSDGTPFTAGDIAFTLQMLAQQPELTNGAEVNRRVGDIEVVDDQNLTIALNSRDPHFIFDILTFRADIGVPIVPEHVWRDQDPTTFRNYDPEQGWPLGTGPYRLVASTVEQKSWDRRDDWWAAETGFHDLPQIERLIFLPGMNEITMAQMLIANEIDMAFSLTPANMTTVQAQNPQIITHSDQAPFGYMDWWPIGLGVNHMREPFGDPEIRWALSYALNRDEILQFAFSGMNAVTALPYPDYPGLKPYLDSLQDLLEQYPTLEYNLTKTDEIMTSKGYSKDGEGFWVKDGQRLAIEIVTFPQHPSTTPAVPIVTEQLRRAGYDATFVLPADFATRIQNGETTAWLWGHGGSMKEPWKTLDLIYHMRWVVPIGEQAFGNFYRWENQEFSDIVDEMGTLESEDPEVTTLFQQAMEIWLRELPDIQLHHTVILVPMNTTYWTNWPNPQNTYIHEGFWHRTALQLFLNLQAVQ